MRADARAYGSSLSLAGGRKDICSEMSLYIPPVASSDRPPQQVADGKARDAFFKHPHRSRPALEEWANGAPRSRRLTARPVCCGCRSSGERWYASVLAVADKPPGPPPHGPGVARKPRLSTWAARPSERSRAVRQLCARETTTTFPAPLFSSILQRLSIPPRGPFTSENRTLRRGIDVARRRKVNRARSMANSRSWQA